MCTDSCELRVFGKSLAVLRVTKGLSLTSANAHSIKSPRPIAVRRVWLRAISSALLGKSPTSAA